MPPKLEFVFADASGRPKPKDRARIRSRCMQSKNKREGSRRSLREARRNGEMINQNLTAKVPPAPPPDMELIQFAEDVRPQSRDLLFKVFSCKALEQAMSPLEHCVDFPAIETDSFDWLFQDASYLHALLLTSSMMHDFASLGLLQPGGRTSFHLRQTISLLNDKLCEPGAHLRDSTLYVVVTLAVLAAVFGDWRAASAHIAGLHKIVQMRGGPKYLKRRPKLHFKLDRIDLAWALSSGQRPCFLPSSISWDALFPKKQQPVGAGVEMPPIDNMVEEKLAVVFRDLQFLAATINENVRRVDRWKGDSFQRVVNSIQTRLLQLKYDDEQCLAECIRLAMLAFLTTLFTIPGRNVPYTFLAARLKNLIRIIDVDCHPNLRLWVMMIIAISIPDIEDDWLIGCWENLQEKSKKVWEDAKVHLLSVMWIECIHDARGERIYEKIRSRAEIDSRRKWLATSPR